MTMNANNTCEKMTEKKEFTKEEMSTFTLCNVNGCSQTPPQTQEEVFIGFYH